MGRNNNIFNIKVEDTKNRCPIGETVGEKNIAQNKIPVLSCEGACIRGEIARLAANIVAKEEPFARACHGELLSVPDSAMARWVSNTEKVVLIDGCFLRCHGRIIEKLIGKEKLCQFDALSVYKKYTDVFDIDDVPQKERKEAARQVANSVLAKLGYSRPG
ncbi:MAG: putative zinc-binding protein [Planctomycetota bacterium]